MLIVDGSSDVCASYLPLCHGKHHICRWRQPHQWRELVNGPAGGRTMKGTKDITNGAAEDVSVASLEELEPGNYFPLPVASDALRQLALLGGFGRAAMRERECKHVEGTGGAGEL